MTKLVFVRCTQAVLLWMVSGCLMAQTLAEMLIEDKFDRGSPSAPQQLEGSLPTTVLVGIVSRPWLTQGWMTDGSSAFIREERSKSAYLPFTPENGKVYELTAKITRQPAQSKEANWIGLSFSEKAVRDRQLFSPDLGAFGALINNKNAVQSVFEKKGAVLPSNRENAVTITVILDTTKELWRAGWRVDGVESEFYPFTANPKIRYIGFGNFTDAEGKIENFTLTVR